RGEDGERAADETLPHPAAPRRRGQALGGELGLDVGERHREARAPGAILGERVVAPEEAAVLAATLPLLRGGAQLVVEAGAPAWPAAPLDEPRPGTEERLVDDLQLVAAEIGVGADEEPRAHQVLDDALGGRAGAEHLHELVALDDGARALGGDEDAECL